MHFSKGDTVNLLAFLNGKIALITGEVVHTINNPEDQLLKITGTTQTGEHVQTITYSTA